MKRVNLLARFMNGQEEVRSLIGDSSATPRKEREAEGRQRKRSGAEGSPRAAILGVCAGKMAGTVSPRRSRIRKALRRRSFRWEGELRDRARSGRARTGEGSPDPLPVKEATAAGKPASAESTDGKGSEKGALENSRQKTLTTVLGHPATVPSRLLFEVLGPANQLRNWNVHRSTDHFQGINRRGFPPSFQF